MRNLVLTLVMIGMFATMSSSRVSGQADPPSRQPPQISNPPQTAELAAPSTNASTLPTSLSGYVPDDRYKLRVGDRVGFQILEDRDLPKSLVVADSGEIDFPYVGRVAAVDKTCKQLSGELKGLLEKEFYFRASVIVALDVANRVLGRV